jgi:hypothetical protein
MQLDRHGRSGRTPPDRRRRPSDGYRLLSGARFVEMVDDIVATMPEPVGTALRGARVVTHDVPPPDARAVAGSVPLVRVIGRDGRARSLEVYRRPLEARALGRLDLAELLQSVIAHEAAAVLGLDLGEEWDDR